MQKPLYHPLTQAVIDAFKASSKKVLQKAEQFNTPVVLWENGKIKRYKVKNGKLVRKPKLKSTGLKNYAIVIERDRDRYRAHVPDLADCTATGETAAEAKRLLRQAMRSHVRAMLADGGTRPEPTTIVDHLTA